MACMKRKKEKPPVRTPAVRVRDSVNINVWVQREIGEAFQRLIETFRPRTSKTSHIEEALRDYCVKLGFPPEKS